jgi:hypothetical protein
MANIRVTGAAMAGMASSLNIVAGAWLVISPFVLNFSMVMPAVWNAIIVGVIVAVLAAFRASSPHRAVSLSWLQVLLGLWLIVSPTVFDFSMSPRAVGNMCVLGVIVAALGLWSALATPPILSHRKV